MKVKPGLGKKVNNLQELRALSLQKKSVVCPKSLTFRRPTPAAFMINLTGFVLVGLIYEDGIYEYIPQEKQKFHEAVRRAGTQPSIVRISFKDLPRGEMFTHEGKVWQKCTDIHGVRKHNRDMRIREVFPQDILITPLLKPKEKEQ